MNGVMPIAGAFLFASCAWFGYVLAEFAIERSGRAERFGDVHPAIAVGIACVAGALVGMDGIHALHLFALSLIVVSLVALARCDVRMHWTPPWISLVPLGFIVAFAVLGRAYWLPVSSLAVSLPFASVALMTKGAGMSWSDVRVAALGTALVGFFPAVITFAAAGLLSAFVQWGLHRRNSIQMAPYLICATVVAALAFAGSGA